MQENSQTQKWLSGTCTSLAPCGREFKASFFLYFLLKFPPRGTGEMDDRLLASARAGKFVSKRGNCEMDAGLAGGPRPLGLRGGGFGSRSGWP